MRRPKVGDIARIENYIWGHMCGFYELKIVEFNFCLGVYGKDGPDSPANFIPLSSLIEPATDAKNEYFPNYGEYFSDYVNTFEIIAADAIGGGV